MAEEQGERNVRAERQDLDASKGHAKRTASADKPRRFPWLTKKLVITIIVIYVVISAAAFLWTTFVSGWGNDLWMMWLW